MHSIHFRDKQGRTVIATSSSVPGLTIVPPGMSIEDGEQMSQKEFEKLTAKVAREFKSQPQIDPRDKQLEELTNLVKALKDDVDRLKKQIR